METLTKNSLGTTIRLQADFDSALARVTDALKAEGSGVLTEIDVKETMKKKLGVDFRRYKILGACNPPLAHRALSASPEVGLLLPCNVTVAEADPASANGTAGKWTEVSLIDPLAMLGVVPNPELQPIAEEAKARLANCARFSITLPAVMVHT